MLANMPKAERFAQAMIDLRLVYRARLLVDAMELLEFRYDSVQRKFDQVQEKKDRNLKRLALLKGLKAYIP